MRSHSSTSMARGSVLVSEIRYSRSMPFDFAKSPDSDAFLATSSRLTVTPGSLPNQSSSSPPTGISPTAAVPIESLPR